MTMRGDAHGGEGMEGGGRGAKKSLTCLDDAGYLVLGGQEGLGLLQDLDKVDAALPALEAALVHARPDVVGPQAGLCLATVVVLGHQLDAHVPELAAGQRGSLAAVQPHLQHAVSNLGGQQCQHMAQVMADGGQQWLASNRERAAWRCRCLGWLGRGGPRRQLLLVYIVSREGEGEGHGEGVGAGTGTPRRN